MATLVAKDSYKVYDPKAKRAITINKGETLEDSDPKVKLARWAFVTPEEAIDPPPFIRTAPVEAATAVPGKKRSVKPKK